MILRISDNLTREERESLEGDINHVVPSYIIDTESANGVIVSFNEFSSSNYAIPKITTLAIQGFRENGMKLTKKSLDPNGYKNLFLCNTRIAFSGYGIQRRTMLKQMSIQMGALIDETINKNTQMMISSTCMSNRVQWALKHNIPVVTENWLLNLFNSRCFVEYNDYFINKLSGIRFTFTSLPKNTIEEETKIINSYGGTVTKNLTENTTYLVIPETTSSKKAMLAIDNRIPMTCLDLIHQSIENQGQIEQILPPFIISQVFSGASFTITDDVENIISSLIRQNGGTISDNGDYVISNVNEGDKYRTAVWVERCVEEGIIISAEQFPLFKAIPRCQDDFSALRVSITGFEKFERLNVLCSLKWMKVNVSPILTKKCTHLIVAQNNTPKYRTAIEWKIPIYSIEWLYALAECGLSSSLEQYCINMLPKPEMTYLDDDDDIDFSNLSPFLKATQKTQQSLPKSPKYLTSSSSSNISAVGTPRFQSPSLNKIPHPSKTPDRSPRLQSPKRLNMQLELSLRNSPHSPPKQQKTLTPHLELEREPQSSPNRRTSYLSSSSDDDFDVLQMEEQEHDETTTKEEEIQHSNEITELCKRITTNSVPKRRRHHRCRNIPVKELASFTQLPADTNEEKFCLDYGSPDAKDQTKTETEKDIFLSVIQNDPE